MEGGSPPSPGRGGEVGTHVEAETAVLNELQTLIREGGPERAWAHWCTARPEVASADLLDLAARLAARCGHSAEESVLLASLARLRPHDAELALRRVATLRDLGRWAEAVEVVTAQIERHPAHVGLWSSACALFASGGALASAEMAAQQALRVSPGHAQISAQLASVWARMGRKVEAASLLGDLKTRTDLAAPAYALMAEAWAALGRSDETIASLERGLQRDPGAVAIRLSLATHLERARRPSEARRHAEQVVAALPDLAPAQRILMRLDHQAGRLDDARDRGLSILASTQARRIRRSTLLELARIYERLGDESAAFGAASEGGRLDLEEWQSAGHDLDRFPQQLEAIRQWRQAAPAAPVLPPDRRAPPIFIVAFPRSGTTLMEQILQAHPAVQTLDEEPIVDEALHDMGHGSLPERIERMSVDEWTRLRALYWQHLDARTLPRHERVVDKLPLNLARIDLLARLFPKAHFLVMLRDPRDCVLSAFMQDFRLSESMIQCADLARCADMYSAVMSIWLGARDDLGLRYREQRYEQLVADPERQIREIIDFLDLPWSDAVLGYHRAARDREISTPSYMDVAKPMYTRASGRWSRYRAQLEPVLPTLEPLARSLGYASALADEGSADT